MPPLYLTSAFPPTCLGSYFYMYLYLAFLAQNNQSSLVSPSSFLCAARSSRKSGPTAGTRRTSPLVSRLLFPLSLPSPLCPLARQRPLPPSSVRVCTGCRRCKRFGLGRSPSVTPARNPLRLLTPSNSHGLGSVHRRPRESEISTPHFLSRQLL
ncbi:hypothetical protein EDB83DRAFT_273339 [Lactarius deliciosus]|nr:hypothetical protein EDB83DRAFT_273339 [Lactarius deliciosus]